MIKAGLDIGNSKISCVIADYKNSENINTHTSPTKNKLPYFILPVTHALCIGLGIFIGLKINSLGDGSL